MEYEVAGVAGTAGATLGYCLGYLEESTHFESIPPRSTSTLAGTLVAGATPGTAEKQTATQTELIEYVAKTGSVSLLTAAITASAGYKAGRYKGADPGERSSEISNTEATEELVPGDEDPEKLLEE